MITFWEYCNKLEEDKRVTYQDNEWMVIIPDNEAGNRYYGYDFDIQDMYNDYCIIDKEYQIPLVYNKKTNKVRGDDTFDNKRLLFLHKIITNILKSNSNREYEYKIKEGIWQIVDGELIVKESLDLSSMDLMSINDAFPKPISVVHGNLDLSKNKLRDIDGLPKKVYGKIDLSHNSLRKVDFSNIECDKLSLKANNISEIRVPSKLKFLDLRNNNLKMISLEHNDIRVLNVSYNPIEKIFNCPSTMTGILAHNCNLTDFEGFPSKIRKDLIVRDNQITSLNGVPDYIGRHFDLRHNQLETISDVDLGDIMKDVNNIKLLGNKIRKEEIEIYSLTSSAPRNDNISRSGKCKNITRKI